MLGLGAAFALLALCGCLGSGLGPRYTGPDANGNQPRAAVQHVYAAEDVQAHAIRRVVVLPVWHAAYRAASDAHLDTEWINALIAQQRFEVIPIGREALRATFGHSQFASYAPLPANFLTRLYHETAADAVLFLDLTTWRPYPPLGASVRTRLVSLQNAATLWAVDEAMTTGHPAVIAAARRAAHTNGGPVPLPERPAYSPRAFWALAASEISATLPPDFATP